MNITNLSQNKAYFMLPGFVEHYKIYQSINNFLLKHPEVKRENAEIYCYYGNVPFCTWDGGRIFIKYLPQSLESMKEIQDYYNNKLNKKIRLVFTNSLLEEKHLTDRYCNLTLSVFNNSFNEIVLNSSLLEEYLLNNYPKYSLVSSTTKCISDMKKSKEEINKEQYKFICLDYNLNHNWKYLDSLTLEEKKKTEFLVNPICGSGCPSRKEHYKLNSQFSLTYGKPYKTRSCKIYPGSIDYHQNKGIISAEEIYSIYLEKEFQYFKIEGRTFSSNEIAILFSEYLIKPEYQAYFLRSIIK